MTCSDNKLKQHIFAGGISVPLLGITRNSAHLPQRERASSA